MSEKTLKTRIIHKHDTESNWLKATSFIPKQGELIVYDIDDTHNYERFKIGDGKTLVSALPFADTTYEEATSTAAGLMSAADKTKLDSNVVTLDGEQTITGNKSFSGKVLINGIDVTAVEPSITVVFDITTANTAITLRGLNNAFIDWGDGSTNTTTLVHNYSNIGKYTCKIYNVTSIGDSAFRDCDSLTSVVIGDSVTYIGHEAFKNCSSLMSVVIGDSVTSIGNFAVDYCSSLMSVVIGDSVTSIGNYAFRDCSSLTSVVIPNSVTSIGAWAFYRCSSLIKVVFKRVTPITYDYHWFPPADIIVVPNEALAVYKEAWVDVADKINGDGFYILPASIEYDGAYDRLNIASPTDIQLYANYNIEVLAGENDDTLFCINRQGSQLQTKRSIKFEADQGINFTTGTKASFNGKVDFSNATIVGLPYCISITYSELIALRDTSQLIPGMFYRITDYVCTTTQEGTRATNNKFDIIVQALSTNELSENASAVVNKGSVSGTNKNYIIKEDVILSATDKTLDSTKVNAVYEEFVDWWSDNDSYVGVRDVEMIFGVYAYLENNEGKHVPVLFEIYNEELDYEQPYFYVGTTAIDGVIYDKWRQIELVSGSDHLTWETTTKKYIYTNTIVEEQIVGITGSDNATISDSVIYSASGNGADQVYTGEDALIEGAVTIHYHIFEDYGEEGKTEGIDEYKDTDQFIAFGYAENNEGTTVPVLYKTDLPGAYDNPHEFGTPDYEDIFFYVGRETLFGTTYDKWRKIDTSDSGEGHDWDNGAHYVYTNIITTDDSSTQDSSYFANAKVNAWKLKYCLDNDTTRFAWADETNGKGVIYYMQDEHGNECPYDFKNIQFERDTTWQEEHSDFIESLGLAVDDVNWFYTFSWVNENLEVEDLTLRQDLVDEEGTARGIHNNKIKTIYNIAENGLKKELNKIVIINSYLCEAGNFYGCYNNIFGNGCRNNTFGNGCNNNTLRSNCENIIFKPSCSGNFLDNECYRIIIGCCCNNNIFESNVLWCQLSDNSNYVRVCQGVTGDGNTLILTPEANIPTPTIYRKNGTKEIILD